MAISLKKGQRVDLTKGNVKLNRIHVGLGWDEATAETGGGFFSKLLGVRQAIDCDASVIMLEDDKFSEVVYFGQLKSKCRSIVHMGDNLTGAGDGDDEVINIDLSQIPSKFNKLVFVVNIFSCKSRNQHFGMIKNAFIRVVDLNNKEELIHFDLTDNHQDDTSLVVAEIYRQGSEWKFAAIGEGTKDISLQQICARYK